MRSLVYVSGPITLHPGGPWMAVKEGLTVGDTLLDAGYAPYVPHLTHYWEAEHNPQRVYEDWMAIDLSLVPRCDALFRIEGFSKGADREVVCAQQHGVPVYTKLQDLYDHVPTERPHWEIQGWNQPETVSPVFEFHFVCPDCHVVIRGNTAIEAGLALFEHGRGHNVWGQSKDDPDVSIPSPVRQAIERVKGTFRRKNADYADDSRTWDSNFRDVSEQMGWDGPQEACEALIAVKQARLRSMRSNGRLPQNESVDDTILDRAVYSTIALALLLEAASE